MADRALMERKAAAVDFVRSRRAVTALEVGKAATKGEPWAAGGRNTKAVRGIGKALTGLLVRNGTLAAEKDGRFVVLREARSR